MTAKLKKNYPTSAWCEIDTKAIKHNLKQIRKIAKETKFFLPTRNQKTAKFTPEVLPIIKANAYGHGVNIISEVLKKEGIKYLGVSDVKEGIELRKLKMSASILIFESTLPQLIPDILQYKLMPTICEYRFAKKLNDYAKRSKKIVDVHIKVDTGMGRLGVWHEEAYKLIKRLHKLEHLRLMGIFTHFPAADTDKNFTLKQIDRLHALVTQLDQQGIIIPFIHAANSVGFAGYKTHILNLSRPGLLLYGMYPHDSLKKKISLKPVMSIHSRVIFVKDVCKGRSISYGRTFFTKKDMRIATIPIGYNDGYMRSLSNKGSVLIKGKRCPVVGRVTMDQIMVDVTHLNRVKIDDPVVIMGKQGKEMISASEIAEGAGTINYEIACSLGNRLEHVIR